MSSPKSTGWGLIGVSTIARQHMLAAIRACAGNRVVAVASSSLERAQAFAAEHAIERAYGSVPALLDDPAVDVIYISSTNDLHHQQVLQAAAAGKHILCEKPLALTVDHALDMARACKNANVLMATNHHLRNAATHRKIKEMLQAGLIGKPLFARVFHAVYLPPALQGWRIDSSRAGGGVILDITVHDLDTLRFTLAAEPTDVTGLTQSTNMAKLGLEDGVMAVVRFDNGVLAQLHDAFTVKDAGTGIEYHGESGSIVGRNVMTQKAVGEIVLRNAHGEQVIAVDHEDLYARSVRMFCQALDGQGVPAATAQDGVRSLAGALAVAQACRTGQTQTVATISI